MKKLEVSVNNDTSGFKPEVMTIILDRLSKNYVSVTFQYDNGDTASMRLKDFMCAFSPVRVYERRESSSVVFNALRERFASDTRERYGNSPYDGLELYD
jgi:hypothetical protein